jgi:hypothetical protein
MMRPGRAARRFPTNDNAQQWRCHHGSFAAIRILSLAACIVPDERCARITSVLPRVVWDASIRATEAAYDTEGNMLQKQGDGRACIISGTSSACDPVPGVGTFSAVEPWLKSKKY